MEVVDNKMKKKKEKEEYKNFNNYKGGYDFDGSERGINVTSIDLVNYNENNDDENEKENDS